MLAELIVQFRDLGGGHGACAVCPGPKTQARVR
jgi:hypothetical protein